MARDGRGWPWMAADCGVRAACGVRVVGRPAHFVWALELTSWPSDMVGSPSMLTLDVYSTARDGSV